MLHKKTLLQRAGILAFAAVVSTAGLLLHSTNSMASDYEIYTIDAIAKYEKLEFAPVPFNHDLHSEAVEDCETCHFEDAEGGMSELFMRLENKSAKQLQDVYHDGCISCHEKMTAAKEFTGPAASECRSCHIPAGVEPFFATTDSEKAKIITQAEILEFLTGPMLWASLIIFFGGMIFRAVWYVRGLDWKLDRVAYGPHLGQGFAGAFWSIISWLIPFRTFGWKKHPLMTLAFFLFHIGAIIVPLFLVGHNVILQSNFGFSLPTLPMQVADGFTIAAIIGIAIMAFRRIAKPEVRILTTPYDWFILILAAAPFVTGFVARLGMVADYNIWLLAHIIVSEILLILAPFTKLSHIVLFFMSRGQLGMDYAIKRGGSSRGAAFPW